MDTKICGRCALDLPVGQFGRRNEKRLQSYCRSCRSEYARQQRKKNPEKEKFIRIKYLYKLTREEYQTMLDKQDGSCAICLVKAKDLHIDHNHATGKVRKLLCGNCNKMLGQAGDNIEILKSAIKYLKANA